MSAHSTPALQHFACFQGARRRSLSQTPVAHSGRFLLWWQRCWRNQAHGGNGKKLLLVGWTSTCWRGCSTGVGVLVVRRCAGARWGPQRKAPGLRKPKTQWSQCRRESRSPSCLNPRRDLLQSTRRHHGPNGTLPSRWDDRSPTTGRESLIRAADIYDFKAKMCFWSRPHAHTNKCDDVGVAYCSSSAIWYCVID